jgi:hypothetical protein
MLTQIIAAPRILWKSTREALTVGSGSAASSKRAGSGLSAGSWFSEGIGLRRPAEVPKKSRTLNEFLSQRRIEP